MNPDESFETLVNAERQAELSRGEAERGWKRLRAAVRSGARPVPVVSAPLSLGAVLFTARAAALLAFAGAGTALAAATWAYRVELGIVSVSRAPGAPVSAPGLVQQKVSGARPDRAHGAFEEGRLTPPSVQIPPSPRPRSERRAESPRSLDAELDLLGRATAELDTGRPNAALAFLQRHADEYPKSMLAPERETLRVLVECRIRPGPRSRALAQQFLSRRPKSLHRDRLRRACSLSAESPGKPEATAQPAPPLQPTSRALEPDATRTPPPPSAAFPEPERP